MKDCNFRHLKCSLCKQVQIFMGNASGQLLHHGQFHFFDDSAFWHIYKAILFKHCV